MMTNIIVIYIIHILSNYCIIKYITMIEYTRVTKVITIIIISKSLVVMIAAMHLCVFVSPSSPILPSVSGYLSLFPPLKKYGRSPRAGVCSELSAFQRSLSSSLSHCACLLWNIVSLLINNRNAWTRPLPHVMWHDNAFLNNWQYK